MNWLRGRFTGGGRNRK